MVDKLKLIAIITPTYNRAKLLGRLFDSLCKQTSHNFKWYIIDDGSSDNTEEVVNAFSTDKFEIQYVKKPNCGKHTAINEAMKIVNEPLSFIVDSDDWLTNDAVSVIEKDYENIKDNEKVCGLGYLKLNSKLEIIGKKYTKDYFVDNFIRERINRNTYGDKAEVYKTEILKQYPFPIFHGENFVSEATVWCDIALKYDMLFSNKGVYVCEYQEGGLSDGVQKRLFQNPNGAVACYLKMSTKPVNLLKKIKYTAAFSVYAFAANIPLKKQFKLANSKFLLFCTFGLAFLIFKKNKNKYSKSDR